MTYCARFETPAVLGLKFEFLLSMSDGNVYLSESDTPYPGPSIVCNLVIVCTDQQDQL